MEGMIKAITKFQNIALITTAGAVGYWYMHDSTTSNFSEDRVADGNTPTAITDSNKAHTLSGEVIARENQVHGFALVPAGFVASFVSSFDSLRSPSPPLYKIYNAHVMLSAGVLS